MTEMMILANGICLDYDEYDAPVLVQYGNDMINTIAYEAVHRRPIYRQLGNDYSYPLQQISYDYDGVGNIVRLSQNAPPYNDYGGEYQISYTYDEQYRLWDVWQNNSALGDYSYTMHYSPSGLVGTKVCPELDADIIFGYGYDGEMPLTHQPKMIHSPSYYEDMTLLSWDAAGQLTYAVQPYQDRFRRHWWNEAGQLSAAISNEYCGYYGYNAQGERTYKLTGTITTDQFNAGEVGINTYLDDMVLYVNPYMVVTPRGYTKHYYNGSQRIAARLGDYWTASVADEPDMIARAREVLEQTMNNSDIEEEHFEEKYVRSIDGEEFYLEPFTLYTHYMTCSYPEDILHEVLNGGARLADHIGGIDRGIFYYHPDHLGSSSWITDDRGQVVQYLHYMPFGELWENQQLSEYDERFKFTGKERDTETGYDYFGARYYTSALPMWLSVDPLADKYPNISPYAYCAWNPIKYVDPDGKEVHNKMNPNSLDSQQQDLYKAAEAFVDNKHHNQIFYIAHGSSDRMYPSDYATEGLDAQGFANYIKNNSELWNATEDKSCLSIVLLSCETGKGDNSIAKQISLLLPDVSIIAPNEEVKAVSNGDQARICGVYKKDAKTSTDLKQENIYGGQWIEFKNGEVIRISEGSSLNYVYRDDE